MALRDGDVISVSGIDITVRHQARTMQEEAVRMVGDISQLSAEELCDRILSEQVAVEDFDSGRLRGWQQLMSAIREVADRPATEVAEVETSEECDRLLDQIREMSEMMNGRTQELDQCESELLAATSLLQETQDRVSQQIEELLGQLVDPSPTNELRVSA
jgi:hypothetical protein